MIICIMAKRRAGVNDIIYELDNGDSELSSDDEVKQPKIIRIPDNNSPNTSQSDSNTQNSSLEVIDVDSSTEKIDQPRLPKTIRNGGKSPVEYIIIDEVSDTASPQASVPKVGRSKKLKSNIIFHDDIIIDSPASNSDPGVVGCENRTPLITVKFKDNKLAMSYKKQIKAFMLSLINLHENNQDSDNDTDLELDIWPEDLDAYTEPEKPADNLFFIDIDPNSDMPEEIPSYSQNTSLICNAPEKALSPPPMPMRKGPTCFNCSGSHSLRECPEPWNNARIAENRKAVVRKGRYHVEDEQKYGHLVPGRISGKLRHALGLQRHELPIHVYRMRLLGYPPGWLEEARISHSGITLFDSSGKATLDPEDEEGEVCEPGSKDKFDIKKILDFPGFNVPATSQYKEEAHALGLPPLSEADSKLAMLAVLAPNAMQAYKRKKLALYPAGATATAGTAEMDIDSGDEIADFPSQPPLPDDAPPLLPPPPFAPPPPETPPPPPPPPSDPPPPPSTKKLPKQLPKETKAKNKENIQSNSKKSVAMTDSDDDLEIVEVTTVGDIPVPFADMITIDVDGDVSEPESGRVSPSLDDLEQKKRLLLDALDSEEPMDTKADSVENHNNEDKDDTTEPVQTTKNTETEDSSKTAESPSDTEIVEEKVDSSNDKPVDSKVADSSSEKPLDVCSSDGANDIIDKTSDKISVDLTLSDQLEVSLIPTDKQASNSISTDKPGAESTITDKPAAELTSTDQQPVESTSTDKQPVESTSTDKQPVESTSTDNPTAGTSSLESTPKGTTKIKSTDIDLTKTPTSGMGFVRETQYGTPVINVASPYMKLPSDDKFAKDICDIINFENLPNSTGKYKKISTLLKKVKNEVDRIQES